jgi:hypothetical protein
MDFKTERQEVLNAIKVLMDKYSIRPYELVDLNKYKPTQLVQFKCGSNRLQHEYVSVGKGYVTCKNCGHYTTEYGS